MGVRKKSPRGFKWVTPLNAPSRFRTVSDASRPEPAAPGQGLVRIDIDHCTARRRRSASPASRGYGCPREHSVDTVHSARCGALPLSVGARRQAFC